MNQSVRVLWVAFFVLAAFGTSQARQDGEKSKAEESVRTFAEAYVSANKAERVVAVRDVGSVKHKLTLGALRKALRDAESDVRLEAIRQIGGFAAVPGAAAALVGVLTDRSNAERPAVRRAAVAALGSVKDRAALPILHGLFEGRDFALAKEAVLAAAKVRQAATIPQLIDLLKIVERNPESLTGTGNVGDYGGVIPGVPGLPRIPGVGLGDGTTGSLLDQEVRKEQEARKSTLHKPVLEALKGLTGERFNTSVQWKDWWKKNSATFRIQD